MSFINTIRDDIVPFTIILLLLVIALCFNAAHELKRQKYSHKEILKNTNVFNAITFITLIIFSIVRLNGIGFDLVLSQLISLITSILILGGLHVVCLGVLGRKQKEQKLYTWLAISGLMLVLQCSALFAIIW